MTQPPPPPNQPPGQPPQGGFGAPQDPVPGGFGAPTPPPQDPSYGYPQTPPPAQPPQGQPGYAYPQAPGQVPGYGYPQGQPQPQPQGQPGYGYPTQPMQPQYMPPQPGGGSGGKKLSTQMQIIIAASVAVVLIVAGGIWFASKDDGGEGKKDEAKNSAGGSTSGSDGGGSGGGKAADGPGKEKAPANIHSKVAFQLPEPAITDITSVKGSWVTDKAYVKPGVNSLVAYDAAKGSPVWTLPLPGQICAASRHLSEDNKAAIVFEAAKRKPPKNYQSCTEVGVVDLGTGKLLWSKSVTGTSSGDGKIKFSEVTQSGTTVAAGGTDGGAAFDLNSGAVRWKPKTDAEGCYDMGYGGGPALVAVRKCGTYDSPQVVIQSLNPDNGTPAFSYKLPPGVEYASIVSTKPLVVAADVGDTGSRGISDFFSIDDKGALRSKISATGDKFTARCGSTEVETCQKVLVGNGRLYLPTAEHEGTGEYGQTNEIVSYDLATGKPTSDRADAGDRFTMFPIRMDGGNVIAYKWPPYDKGGQIVSIDGATFKQTVLMDNPADKAVREAETSYSTDGAEYRYTNGRLYIGATLMSKRTSSSFGKKYLTVAFSTAD
ncbi:PQQ-binding-like beta-propeller repeat protein [Streptomyces sp. NBC_00885]|uniref:outer membrane protein assembly factor BamB family protein n=1 Tax=Streptomyces sp. NBC_00885 TaxID=2975857 RepID=UPI0038669F29|nr:PQQ-binding-like beta-propeller repeat protein [Streptomyces sp. NBC_00885]